MSRPMLLGAIAAPLALLLFAILWASRATTAPGGPAEGRSAPGARSTQRARAEPARAELDIAETRQIAASEAAPERTPGETARAEALPEEGDHHIFVEVLSQREGAPLAGWEVVVSEVGAERQAMIESEHRLRLDAAGRAAFADLPAPGPWYVWLGDADPGATPTFVRYRQLGGGLLATEDVPTAPARFTVKTGPRVVLTSALPPSVTAGDLRFRLEATPSPLSNQMGGLGGVAQGVETPLGSAAADLPALTNYVRGDGGFLEVWSADGRWALTDDLAGRLDDAMTIEIESALRPAGRVRFRLVPEDTEMTPALRNAIVSLLRQEIGDAEGGSRTRRRPSILDQGENTYEVHGLALGPVWIEAGAESLGFTFAPFQANADSGTPRVQPLQVVQVVQGR